MKIRGRRKHIIVFFYLLCFGWTCFILWYGVKQEKMIQTMLKYGNQTLFSKGIDASGILSWNESISKRKFQELFFCGDLLEFCKEKIDMNQNAALSEEMKELIVSEMNANEKDNPEKIAEKKELLTEEVTKPIIEVFDNGSGDITKINAGNSDMHKDQDDKVIRKNKMTIAALNKSYSRSLLLKKFYIMDSSTSIDNNIFQVKKLVHMDLRIKKTKEPQVLIFHTHGASESFVDSKKGKEEDSIIGVGTELAKELSEKYGYQVIHDKTPYDRIGGKIDRNKAYNNAYEGVNSILKKYPSIQVVIDLHRDGVGNRKKKVVTIGGKKTAQVMFFNGLSRNASGNIAYLKNKNLQGNLAFSLQLKMACMQHYEEFAKPIYLKSYRYNMHLRKRFTLIELGNENNTVAEEKNAVIPLARVIDEVLCGKSRK